MDGTKIADELLQMRNPTLVDAHYREEQYCSGIARTNFNSYNPIEPQMQVHKYLLRPHSPPIIDLSTVPDNRQTAPAITPSDFVLQLARGVCYVKKKKKSSVLWQSEAEGWVRKR